MADKGSKPNWLILAREFMALQESKGMKIKEFALLHCLNENSARRGISQAIKLIRSGNSDQDNFDHIAESAMTGEISAGDQELKKRGRKPKASTPEKAAPAGEKPKRGRPAKAVTHDSTRGRGGDQNGGKGVPQRDQKNDHGKKGKPALKVITGEVITLPKNKGGAPVGNDNGLLNGKKKKIKPEDVAKAIEEMKKLELPEGWQNSLPANLVQDIIAHLNLVLRAREKASAWLVKEIMELEINPEPIPLPGDSVIPPTPPHFKWLKMLTDTGYSITDLTRTITQTLMQIQKEARDAANHRMKLEQHQQKLQHERENHQLKMYGKMRGGVIREAFQMLEGNNGSAIKAAQFLEDKGIKLPFTLEKMLEVELAREKDKVDESGGISDEELDNYVAQEEAKRAGHHVWLAEKRKVIAEIVDMHGYGDIDADGVRRSDEIQAAFQPGEEVDESATADMYGDGELDTADELPPEEEDAALWTGEGQFSDDDEPDETIDDFEADE